MTLPNALTLLRILAIPFFAIALWYGHLLEACGIFAAAGVTDLLDGWIARRFNQRSDLGAILDPAADKLLMTTAFVLMAWRTEHLAAPIPVWVAILAISRDVLISLYSLAVYAKLGSLRLPPSRLGKLSTATQLVAISVGLLLNAGPPNGRWIHILTPGIYYAVALMAALSGLHYFFTAHAMSEGE